MPKKGELVATGFPGIKQRKSNGMYVVTLDLGRQRRWNKRTGQYELMQVKTGKSVSTLKEAKALLGKNAQIKRHQKTSDITRVIRFDDAMQDFLTFHEDDWNCFWSFL